MIQHIRDYVEFVAGTFPLESPVVEIGSYLVPGQEELANMRPFFKGMDYLGCDIRHGPGVDQIEDLHKLTFADESAGTLLVLETLEHVKNPFLAFAEMERVLTSTGLLVISVPFYFPIHEFPSDYWRYTPHCLDMLLSGFKRIISWENADLEKQEAGIKPRTVFAIASKREFPVAAKDEILNYCQAAGHHILNTEWEDNNEKRDSHASKKFYRTHWRSRF